MFLFLLGYAYRISTAGFVDKIYFNIYLYCSDKCEGTYYKVGTVRVTQTDSDKLIQMIGTIVLKQAVYGNMIMIMNISGYVHHLYQTQHEQYQNKHHKIHHI